MVKQVVKKWMMRSQMLKVLFPFLGLLMLFTGFNSQAADYGYNIGTDDLCAED